MLSYKDHINQHVEFPTNEFDIRNNQLLFNGVDIMQLIEQYGTPFKLTYLPKISHNIQKAKRLFTDAIKRKGYKGSYTYSYCTKSSHFEFVLNEALKNDIHIETSSAFDIHLLERLYQQKKISKATYILCNGYKRPHYLDKIAETIASGFKNCIPILDNMSELDFYEKNISEEFQLGLRMASEEEPTFSFYTSRLGIRYNDIIGFYKERLANHPKIKLKMLHFFINTGIKDTAYYWSELNRFLDKYCELKEICPELDSIDIGGGFPVKNSLQFDYDYEYMVEQIIEYIQSICRKKRIPEPNIYTEFGSYTVAESGATIYSVLDQKLQNDRELWYMMDGSFISHLPDTWALSHKFIMLPINKWNDEYHKVNLGGLTCDSMDYYDSESHLGEVFLPKIKKEEQLFFGFFHTGAYQESLGGYGGIQHCLIPAPKHILIDKDVNGSFNSSLFAEEQTGDSMLKVLGYK